MKIWSLTITKAICYMMWNDMLEQAQISVDKTCKCPVFCQTVGFLWNGPPNAYVYTCWVFQKHVLAVQLKEGGIETYLVKPWWNTQTHGNIQGSRSSKVSNCGQISPCSWTETNHWFRVHLRLTNLGGGSFFRVRGIGSPRMVRSIPAHLLRMVLSLGSAHM